MRVTGYSLREAIKLHDLRRSTAAGQFKDSLHRFADEKKTTPQEVVNSLLASEKAIALLQTAQAEYNLKVIISVRNLAGIEEIMTLSEAIKSIGGIARAEKMWRSVASPEQNRFSYREPNLVREAGQVHAEQTINQLTALELATKMAKYAGAIRAAIAVANAKEMEIESLDSKLFG